MTGFKLTDERKKLLGVFSFVCPGVMLLAIIITCIISVIMAATGADSDAAFVFIIISAGFLILASFVALVLMIAYLIFEITDKTEKTDQKVLWIVIIIIAQWLSLPFYWYFRVHKREF